MNDDAPITAQTPPPPEPPTPPPPGVKIDIGAWLKQSWEIFAKDWLKYSLSALIVLLITIVTCGILGGPMFVGFYQCILKKMRGEDYEIGELFNGIKTQFLPAFLVMFIALLIPMIISRLPFIGFLSGIVSIVIAPVLYFTLIHIAEKTATVPVGELKDLVMKVFNDLQSQYLMWIIWLLIIQIISGIGMIACIIGVFVTTAYATIGTVVSYKARYATE